MIKTFLKNQSCFELHVIMKISYKFTENKMSVSKKCFFFKCLKYRLSKEIKLIFINQRLKMRIDIMFYVSNKKKWNFLWQTNNIKFNFVDRCPRHRNQRQDDGMSSLELVLQSVQGARRTESTKHRENSTVPDHFRVTVQQGNWLRNHRGFYLDQQWMQWNLQSGILYRYCFEPPNTKELQRIREHVTCIVFFTRSYEVSFYFL